MRRIAVLALVVLTNISSSAADSILLNGGFETGDLTGWTQESGTGVVVPSSSEMDPSTPRSGGFLHSSSNPDGADRLGQPEITLLQTIDVSGFAYIAAGVGRVTAQGFFSGALGEPDNTSDDTAQIVVEFFQGGAGGTLLDTVSTSPIDPIVGIWNEVAIPSTVVPATTDTLKFRVRTVLDPGFSSIDIGGDDFSLVLIAVPEASSLILFCIGAVVLLLRHLPGPLGREFLTG